MSKYCCITYFEFIICFFYHFKSKRSIRKSRLKIFCKRLKIKCKLFTTFQFEIDDQIERTNQNIETRLRLYCNYRQNDWIDWIDIMKFVDNNDVSTITKFISFFINKNYHSRMIFDSNLNDYETSRKRLLIKKRIYNKKNESHHRIRQNQCCEYQTKNDCSNQQNSFFNQLWNKKLCVIELSLHKDNSFIRQTRWQKIEFI